jgi:hypothetical protein
MNMRRFVGDDGYEREPLTAEQFAAMLNARPCGDGWKAICPAHDDKKPSLSIRQGTNGKVLLYCHAGCSKENILRALNLTWKDICGYDTVNPSGNGERHAPEIEKTYDYVDENSNLVFQVVRRAGKRFIQRRPDPDNPGQWLYSTSGIRKVLYNLPRVIDAVTAGLPVYIVEGEKDADNLTAIGLTATTNPGGSGKWKQEYSEVLKGAHIIVLPDNDPPGVAHAKAIEQALSGITSSITTVMLPGLPPHGDVSDWLNSGGSRVELEKLVQAAASSTPSQPPSTTPTASAAGNGKPKKALTVAQVLIQYGLQHDLFIDQYGEAYAALADEPGTRVIPVNSREFKGRIVSYYYDQFDATSSSESVNNAIMHLDAKARTNGARELHNRFCKINDSIWFDLGDGRAVHITASGWSIDDKPPILFRRYSHQKALPTPDRTPASDLIPLLGKYFDPMSDEHKLLLTTWMVAALVSQVPRSILVLHGPAGAAKTTRARFIRSILDPSVVSDMGLGDSEADLARMLDHHAVPVFDNLSVISEWQESMLSRAVTGSGFTKRKLYTDSDDTIMVFRRAIIITGINVPVIKPDAVDRCLLVECDRIDATNRKPEGQLWEDFEKDKPKILGALLSAASGMLAALPNIAITQQGRMADWQAIATAAAASIGHDPAEFETLCLNKNKEKHGDLVDEDPAGYSIRVLALRGGWEGTPAELLEVLNNMVSIDTRESRRWPRDPIRLSKRLKILYPALAESGVQVNFTRKWDNSRRNAFRYIEIKPIQSALESEDEPKPDTRYGTGYLYTDADDDFGAFSSDE